MKNPWLAWYPGDYIGKTRTLTMSQHGAYLLLLWEYYINGPISAHAQQVLNICLAHTEHEKADVSLVLGKFFTLVDGEYRHERADEELSKREDIRSKRVKAGLARQNQGSTCSAHAQQMPTQSQPQLHIESKAKEALPQGTRLPPDFTITDEIRSFCKEGRLPEPDSQLAQFRDYWNAVPGAKGRKADWPATFRNWMRKTVEYGGSNGNTPSRTQQRVANNQKAILAGLNLSPESGSGEPDLPDGIIARGSPRLAESSMGSKG